MPHSHAAAKAFSDHRLAMQLLAANDEVNRCTANANRLLEAKLEDPRNQIAHRAWLKSCSLLALAQARMDHVVAQFAISAALQKEMAS